MTATVDRKSVGSTGKARLTSFIGPLRSRSEALLAGKRWVLAPVTAFAITGQWSLSWATWLKSQ